MNWVCTFGYAAGEGFVDNLAHVEVSSGVKVSAIE